MATALANRREFSAIVRDIVDNSDSKEDSDEELEQMDTDRYNNNDEDLTSYVREFKTKVNICNIDWKYIY